MGFSPLFYFPLRAVFLRPWKGHFNERDLFISPIFVMGVRSGIRRWGNLWGKQLEWLSGFGTARFLGLSSREETRLTTFSRIFETGSHAVRKLILSRSGYTFGKRWCYNLWRVIIIDYVPK